MTWLRKRKFPAWLAAMAILGALLIPMKFSAAESLQAGAPCAHPSSDGMTSDVPVDDMPDGSCADEVRCALSCGALAHVPVFHIHITPSDKPATVAASTASWLVRPEHPPPIA